MAVLGLKRILAAFLLVIMIVSCSASSNYNVLSFFFDGVPDPNAKKNKSDLVQFDSSLVSRREEIVRKATPKFVLHGPYKAKLCGDCHSTGQGFSLLEPLPNLCFKCHDTFDKKVKFSHGPVAAGLCTVCHKPHRSENKFLLVKKNKEICLYCHNVSDVILNKKHPEIVEDTNCIDCHDAHGGEKQYFLRQ